MLVVSMLLIAALARLIARRGARVRYPSETELAGWFLKAEQWIPDDPVAHQGIALFADPFSLAMKRRITRGFRWALSGPFVIGYIIYLGACFIFGNKFTAGGIVPADMGAPVSIRVGIILVVAILMVELTSLQWAAMRLRQGTLFEKVNPAHSIAVRVSQILACAITFGVVSFAYAFQPMPSSFSGMKLSVELLFVPSEIARVLLLGLACCAALALAGEVVRLGLRLATKLDDPRTWPAPTHDNTLYLRSFKDDTVRLATDIQADAGRTWLWPRSSFEEFVALCGMRGRTITIGDPRERLPKIGATRAYFSDDEWRLQVERAAQRCGRILLVAGETPNLSWEIGSVKEWNLLPKTFFLIPPLGCAAVRRRIRMLLDVLEIPQEELNAISDEQLSCALLLNVRPNGALTWYYAPARHWFCYWMVMQSAEAIALHAVDARVQDASAADVKPSGAEDEAEASGPMVASTAHAACPIDCPRQMRRAFHESRRAYAKLVESRACSDAACDSAESGPREASRAATSYAQFLSTVSRDDPWAAQIIAAIGRRYIEALRMAGSFDLLESDAPDILAMAEHVDWTWNENLVPVRGCAVRAEIRHTLVQCANAADDASDAVRARCLEIARQELADARDACDLRLIADALADAASFERDTGKISAYAAELLEIGRALGDRDMLSRARQLEGVTDGSAEPQKDDVQNGGA